MNIWAIVPVKPLKRSKSRLSPVLSVEQREAFSRVMLEHTLSVIRQVDAINETIVITRDTAVLALARDHHAQTLQETQDPDLVKSLTFATQVAAHNAAAGILIVASDIPFLQPDDLNGMIELAEKALHPRLVVLAPDRREDGTNALLVSPPGAIAYRFGVGSFHKHIAEANQIGASVSVYRSDSIALDIDVPNDLAIYRESLRDERWPGAADVREVQKFSAFDQINFSL
ncbi:MAG: 2-phospho-L-lactate guanylyltransferase [Chloroflexi bacterium]|nr:2-phospho-L-lactate guanylyltransferase [Chloroflexota bacterium]